MWIQSFFIEIFCRNEKISTYMSGASETKKFVLGATIGVGLSLLTGTAFLTLAG
jgi:hypothetical protein